MFKYSELFKKKQKGAVVVLVAILLIVFLGMAALAIDVYHLFVVRNELQNAADAAALAGARELYLDDGSAINPNANTIAYNTALQNLSEKIAVEVNDYSSNSGDVQRGHWSFSAERFDANDSLSAIAIGNYTTEDLDNPDPSINGGFINAVKVVVRRQDKPAASFFAQIFGFENFGMTAEAIAYLGFAGSLPPGTVDVPIALCEDYLKDADGNYSCNMGRMISESEETGGWTNFDQTEGCGNVGTSQNGIGGLLCNGGNPVEIIFGKEIGTNNGMTNLLSDFYDNCWTDGSNNPPTVPLNVTLPVVECEDGTFDQSCVEKVVGAVSVDIIWINTNKASENFGNVGKNKENPPTYMVAPGHEPFSCSYTDAQTAEACWNNFVNHFDIKDRDGNPAPYLTQSIYFLPSCEVHKPTGITGGVNYGVLSEFPALVD